MKESLINLVERLLKRNKILFDKQELAFQIQSHPSYPSLHAITGVLDHFNIDNLAIDVPVNTETLVQLPNCFIAQISTHYGKELVVVERKKLDYLIFNVNNKKEKKSETDFLKEFTGIVVAVEQLASENKVEKKSNLWQTIAIISTVFLAFFLIYKSSNSWDAITHLILSVVGVIASVAIIKQELGLKTTIGDAFCSGIDDKKDCDAVLTSKGAEIIKGYKLSDFSILYFSGLTLLTLFKISNPIISFSISLLVIPITIYSLYYQYAVIKKWCLLCLTIVGILWLQALISIFTKTPFTNFQLNNFLLFGLVTSSIWLVWKTIKPLFIEVNQLRKEKIESVKFKRNFTLFESLLQKSPSLNTQLPDSKEILLGNPNANLEIVVVTSPFCGHCKPVHTHIDEILHKYKEKVKIKVRFNVNTENENNDLVKITTKLLEIYNEEGNENCLETMGDIYERMSPNKWLEKWGNCFEKEVYIEELEKQSQWCRENAINFTPEILVNGKSFPKEYNRTDLIFFIEELEENCCVETVHNN